VASLICALLAPAALLGAAISHGGTAERLMAWTLLGSPLAAIVFGWVSTVRIRRSGGSLQGRALAKAGVVVGIVDLVLLAAGFAALIWWISHWDLTF